MAEETEEAIADQPASELHPDIEKLLRYFEYQHLSKELQQVSKHFHELAYWLMSIQTENHNPELTMALRKLLEAKDCAVRAALDRP